MKNTLKIKSLTLAGYKSINQEGQTIEFGDVTVLLGANGAGKSNLISFFDFLSAILVKSMQEYIAEEGFADSILYYGKKNTSNINASLKFCIHRSGSNFNEIDYNIALASTKGDTLIFAEEYALLCVNDKEIQVVFNNDLKESGIPAFIPLSINSDDVAIENKEEALSQIIIPLLSECQIFQFHDTSESSKIRSVGYINDNLFLLNDGRNIAAYLYVLKNKFGDFYKRIVRYIQQMMPQFGDFILNPSPLNENHIFLNWKEIDSDYTMGPHQISDGTLRFMCLATLLLSPPEELPKLIIIDEPELGLHPSAISMLAGMIKTASKHCQVLIANQSTRFVDEFEAENIVIVDRNQETKSSEFKKLDEDKLAEWLERYSLSELWEKNVFGGRP